jgi:hypothetical protein
VIQLQEIMMNKDADKRFQTPTALLSGIRKCYRAVVAQAKQSKSSDTNVPSAATTDTVVIAESESQSGGLSRDSSGSQAESVDSTPTSSPIGSPSSGGSPSVGYASEGSPSGESKSEGPSSGGPTSGESSTSDSQFGFVLKPKSLSGSSRGIASSKVTKPEQPVATKPPMSKKQRADRWIVIGAGVALAFMLLGTLVWMLIPKKGPTATILVGEIPADVEIFINNEKATWKPQKGTKKLVTEVKPGTLVFSYRRNGQEFRKHQLRIAVDEEHELKPDFTATPFGVGEGLPVEENPEPQ